MHHVHYIWCSQLPVKRFCSKTQQQSCATTKCVKPLIKGALRYFIHFENVPVVFKHVQFLSRRRKQKEIWTLSYVIRYIYGDLLSAFHSCLIRCYFVTFENHIRINVQCRTLTEVRLDFCTETAQLGGLRQWTVFSPLSRNKTRRAELWMNAVQILQRAEENNRESERRYSRGWALKISHVNIKRKV